MKGPGDEGPATLGEVAMILEFPMAEGALRGLASPCDMAHGETRRFDGADVLHRASQPVEKSAVSGSIIRHGLRFSYTFLWNEPPGTGRAAQRCDGVWEKSPGLEMFPLSTPVGR